MVPTRSEEQGVPGACRLSWWWSSRGQGHGARVDGRDRRRSGWSNGVRNVVLLATTPSDGCLLIVDDDDDDDDAPPGVRAFSLLCEWGCMVQTQSNVRQRRGLGNACRNKRSAQR